MAMPIHRKRLKTLNGAPLTGALEWNEANLITELIPAFSNFLNKTLLAINEGDETSQHIKWRHISSSGTRLRSGWSQPYLPQGEIYSSRPEISFSVPDPRQSFEGPADETTFFGATNPLNNTSHNDDDEAFVQHSLLFHDTFLNSQFPSDADADNTVNTASFLTTSFATTTTGTGTGTSSPPPQQDISNTALPIPPILTITPLSALPSPDHIRAIYPQTPTPNLLCVLTSISPPRDIHVRKGAYRMQLQELSVADETSSSLTISFWLRPSTPSKRNDIQESLRTVLSRLKVGDILLLRNIALNVFRNTVYGQSLNAAITQARTSIDVLMRGDGVRITGELPPALGEKFERVRRWASKHIVPDYVRDRKRKRGESMLKSSVGDDHDDEESLPPDTFVE
ncbi:hypothetical protein BCR34DRAFT_511966 [Clohesyomyces aquaticus]|uniref:Uncharacterized protein n=1 Tax=Clohesyomyces aquaticus TaxID=1231657 RepID=A0A1Y1ZRH1_9PLEO|nr:hypothetical protein BCR34DRAFT_511966 [Clohesyomyces aquaticus]